VPASRQNDPRALAYVIDHVSGGTTFTRTLEVRNSTERPERISIYPAAADIVDGSFVVGDGRAENDLTTWVTVEPEAAQLAPGAATLVEVTFAVPADAPDGEHYGAIMAEVAPAGRSGGVAIGRRVGIRVYLSVGDGAEPASDFDIRSLAAGRQADRRPVVAAEVVNTGRRALDMRGELELREGPGGTSAGPFDVVVGTTLAAGDTAPVRVVLDEDLPAGPWTARITLRSGRLERQAEAVITFPDDAGAFADPVEADDVERRRRIFGPIAAALIALLLAALALYARERRRRRRAAAARA